MILLSISFISYCEFIMEIAVTVSVRVGAKTHVDARVALTVIYVHSPFREANMKSIDFLLETQIFGIKHHGGTSMS